MATYFQIFMLFVECLENLDNGSTILHPYSLSDHYTEEKQQRAKRDKTTF